jgi:hypothetical protein
MICGGQVIVPQPPLCIKIHLINENMRQWDGFTSNDIFTLKYTYLMKRGGKGTAKPSLAYQGPLASKAKQ